MQNLESLKRSIKSAEDLGGVVRTMKTMAAVSIRQYETAARSLSVYSDTVEIGLAMLLRHSDEDRDAIKSGTQRTGAILFGSDQGMCGQFNDQVSEFCVAWLNEHAADAAPALCVGHRVADKFSGSGRQTDRILGLPGSAVGITDFVQDLLSVIDEWRQARDIDRILVFHNRRLKGSAWQPCVQQLLPFRLDELRHRATPDRFGRSVPLWTMDTGVLFSRLVRQFLFVSLFRACAESLAGENASRITAMQSAERNINDRLHWLRTEYGQQRQTTITEELLDVVTGFEALSEEQL